MSGVKCAAITALILLLAACGSGGEQRFPDEMRADYMNSCLAGGSGEAYCRCTLEYIETRYTEKELEELISAVDRSERLGEFLEIIEACS